MAEAETQAEGQAAAQTLEPSEFSSLLEKEFRPKSDRAKSGQDEVIL